MRLSVTLAALVAATGLFAAAAAVGWDTVTRTEPESGWRDLLGTFAALSISSAVVGAFLGIIALIAWGWRLPHAAAAVVGLALGASTLGYWIWVIQHIG